MTNVNAQFGDTKDYEEGNYSPRPITQLSVLFFIKVDGAEDLYVPAHGEEIIKRIKKEINHLAKSKTETKMKYKKLELKYTSKGEHQFNQPSIPFCKIGRDKKSHYTQLCFLFFGTAWER